MAPAAWAQDWPSKPVTLIMGFPAGSGVDVVASASQEPLARQLGQPVIIDYKSGAAGNIASGYVAHAKPDGYTLAFGPNSPLGLDMVHVPYKGDPEAITSVVRGETRGIMNQVQTVLPYYKSGTVRLLGVTTAAAVAAIREVPTIAASGLPGTKGFYSSIWFGVFAPNGTDAHVVNKLNAAIKTVLEQTDLRARFESQGNSVRMESPAQFKQTVHANREKSARAVKIGNIYIYIHIN